jgi:hypothetical protein
MKDLGFEDLDTTTFEMHLPHVQWLPNPHRARVEEEYVPAIEHALKYVAEMQKRSLPKTLVEALLLDTSLGVKPVLGDELCIQKYQ